MCILPIVVRAGSSYTSQDLYSECAHALYSSGKGPERNFQLWKWSSAVFSYLIFSFSLLIAEYFLVSYKLLVIFDLDYFNEYSKAMWVFVLILLPFYFFPPCYRCLRLSHDFRIWACGLQGWAHCFAWAMGERTWQWARHGPDSHQVRSI